MIIKEIKHHNKVYLVVTFGTGRTLIKERGDNFVSIYRGEII